MRKTLSNTVPADVFEATMERLDDLDLAQLAKARIEANETPMRVSFDNLIAEAQSDIANKRPQTPR
ncbi:hypothetical protein HX882_17710 [Pseudomonas gingeri]|uniref:Uncharacterized protein n=1 Tax=Pseudomonas gingeri TaxID=117681 RepID=A0A7Y7XFC1_9PSED|nr:hypothetical protein [Pseudomonas gingeri]